jgi:hypothetical protein
VFNVINCPRLSKLKMKALLLVCLITASIATPLAGSDEIKFAFQLTRHGARAPSDECEGFKVSAGMLTA